MLELLVTTLPLINTLRTFSHQIRDSSGGIQNINRTIITDVSHRSHVVVRLLARLIGMLVTSGVLEHKWRASLKTVLFLYE